PPPPPPPPFSYTPLFRSEVPRLTAREGRHLGDRTPRNAHGQRLGPQARPFAGRARLFRHELGDHRARGFRFGFPVSALQVRHDPDRKSTRLNSSHVKSSY